MSRDFSFATCELRKLLQGRGVIRYSPFLSVVPYFSENLSLYLIIYRCTPFPKNSQDRVPYKHPLPVPYRHSLAVTYNVPPCITISRAFINISYIPFVDLILRESDHKLWSTMIKNTSLYENLCIIVFTFSSNLTK